MSLRSTSRIGHLTNRTLHESDERNESDTAACDPGPPLRPVRPYVGGMDDRKIVFGVFMPQGWKMELSEIDGATAKWERAMEIALLAEELGYDSIWVYDHVHNVPRPSHEAVFECWTTVAALSQRTSQNPARPDGGLQ
jgi:hypothetical protein